MYIEQQQQNPKSEGMGGRGEPVVGSAFVRAWHDAVRSTVHVHVKTLFSNGTLVGALRCRAVEVLINIVLVPLVETDSSSLVQTDPFRDSRHHPTSSEFQALQ
jgi:hypothetical protein